MTDVMHDRFGAAITTASPMAVRAWEDAVFGLLSHASHTADLLRAALDADPELCVAHCLKGFALRTLARRDLLPAARESLACARRSLAARGGTPREHRLVAALAAWCDGDSARAACELAAILEATPADPFALKIDHACRFMRGDGDGMRRHAERAARASDANTPGHGFALGMLAFAREEAGDYEGAERAAREALEHAPDDAWGAHALAHVHQMRDRAEAGRAWLDRCIDAGTFAHCNNFGGHVRWHLAIFCVELGEHERALALYDDVLRYPAGDFREITNAASLLFRLEQDGIAVGARWASLADRVAPHAGDHGYAFADAHYALTLMRAGRASEARALLASLRRHALADASPDARAQRELGVPIVSGVVALEEGRAADAFDDLACAADGAPRLGGSHAQRDIFRRLWIAAAIATGDADRCARALDAYAAYRPWASAIAPRELAMPAE